MQKDSHTEKASRAQSCTGSASSEAIFLRLKWPPSSSRHGLPSQHVLQLRPLRAHFYTACLARCIFSPVLGLTHGCFSGVPACPNHHLPVLSYLSSKTPHTGGGHGLQQQLDLATDFVGKSATMYDPSQAGRAIVLVDPNRGCRSPL